METKVRIIHEETVVAIANKLSAKYEAPSIVFVAHKDYVGQAHNCHISDLKVCDVVINKFPLLETAHINFKRRFVRMATPMNAFIAICRYMRANRIVSKKAKLSQLAFHFQKLGHGKLIKH